MTVAGRSVVARLRQRGARGVVALMRCRLDQAWLEVLRRRYGFHRWHSSAPYACRPYKKLVVHLADSVRPNIVIEVGCGLGDLVSRIHARERYGYDIDLGVINAARLLHGRRVTFIHGEASDVRQPTCDLLIMVNWIHQVDPVELERIMRPLALRSRFLLLDAVDPDGPEEYRFKHDFAFLEGWTEEISAAREPSEPRTFRLLRVMTRSVDPDGLIVESGDRAS